MVAVWQLQSAVDGAGRSGEIVAVATAAAAAAVVTTTKSNNSCHCCHGHKISGDSFSWCRDVFFWVSRFSFFKSSFWYRDLL